VIRFYSAANLQEAHLLLHLLEQAGVEAHVFNENAQGGMGELPFTHTYPEIWLEHREDARIAREVIDRFERNTLDDRTVLCQHCREYNPANFELCWQCGQIL